jgi:hypothetical protein
MTPQAMRIQSGDDTKSVPFNEIACVASGAWTHPTHSDANQRIKEWSAFRFPSPMPTMAASFFADQI